LGVLWLPGARLAIKRKDGSTVKKFLALFMAFAMAASMLTVTVGCGDTKKADAPKKDAPAKAEDPPKK
jgi:hypothetical protein